MGIARADIVGTRTAGTGGIGGHRGPRVKLNVSCASGCWARNLLSPTCGRGSPQFPDDQWTRGGEAEYFSESALK